MNEKIWQMINDELEKREFEECAEPVAEHIFSKKHKRAMKRIFKLYEKNIRKMKSRHCSSTSQNIKEGA